MKAAKKQRLEARGWQFGSAADFLELTPEQATYINLKLSLSRKLKALRTERKMSQSALAKQLHSSQSRVAKMEAGDASVSLDLLVKSLLAVGASSRDLAQAIAAAA